MLVLPQILKGVSPVAWRHVNLTGTFDFSATASPLDLDALTARYSGHSATIRWLSR